MLQVFAAMKEIGIPRFQAWLRFTDEGSEGKWRDIWTGENQNFSSIPWKLATEPTGYIIENCSGVLNDPEDVFWAYDVDCMWGGSPSVCQNIKFYFR